MEGQGHGGRTDTVSDGAGWGISDPLITLSTYSKYLDIVTP